MAALVCGLPVEALDCAESVAEGVLHRAAVWRHAEQHPLNERQRIVLGRFLDDFKGRMTNAKYAKLAKCSADTALRDLRQLVAWNILTPDGAGGRSAGYVIQDVTAAVDVGKG